MSDTETPDEVLAAIEDGPRGDLGRHCAGAEPVVDNALASLMAMVREHHDRGDTTGDAR